MARQPIEAAIPRLAALTKDQLWAEIEAGTAAELAALEQELLTHGYTADGRSVSRIRERLATFGA